LGKIVDEEEAKKDSKGLQEVYDEHGLQSTEMWEYSFRYIRYLIMRYCLGEYDEELHFKCWTRLIETCITGFWRTKKGQKEFVPPYYNKEETNIATWIHSVVRNQASTYMYNKLNDNRVSEEELKMVKVEDEFFKNPDSVGLIHKTLREMVSVEFLDVDLLAEIVPQMTFDSIIKRAVIWEVSRHASR